jgi:hypothetical protein
VRGVTPSPSRCVARLSAAMSCEARHSRPAGPTSSSLRWRGEHGTWMPVGQWRTSAASDPPASSLWPSRADVRARGEDGRAPRASLPASFGVGARRRTVCRCNCELGNVANSLVSIGGVNAYAKWLGVKSMSRSPGPRSRAASAEHVRPARAGPLRRPVSGRDDGAVAHDAGGDTLERPLENGFSSSSQDGLQNWYR